jgi:hypothetical protein
MSLYFSPSCCAFFDSDIHGVRTIVVDDVEQPNPECKIPADAVEITVDQHQALLNEQAAGKVITAGAGGQPCAVDPPPPSTQVLAARGRAKRNALLAACDWTQLPDVPETSRASWQTYRQQLRDWPASAGFPDLATLPASPA